MLKAMLHFAVVIKETFLGRRLLLPQIDFRSMAVLGLFLCSSGGHGGPSPLLSRLFQTVQNSFK